MKSTILMLLTILTFSTFISHAQQSGRELNELKLEKYTKMKKNGITLLISGGVCTIGGIVLLSNVDWEETSDGYGNTSYHSDDSNAGLGMLLTLAGVALTTTGTVLALVGDHSKKKYQNRLNSVSIKPVFRHNQSGFLLTYRF
jgi:hypothetical protein